MDLDLRLIVGRRGEDLGASRWDRRVALDHLGRHATLRLNAERQWGHVEEENPLYVSLEDPRLECRAVCHDLVRVHALVRLLACKLVDDALHGRHAGRSADEDDLIDVGHRHATVFECFSERHLGALEEILGHLLELRASEGAKQVNWTLVRGGDERQVDLGFHDRRQVDLGLLCRFLEAGHRHGVRREVNTVVVLEAGDEPVDDSIVPVVAAEGGVAVGGLHLEDAFADLEHRHVERASAEVVHENEVIVLGLVESVCQGCGGRFVDDAQDLEACDLAGFLGRLALRIPEVGRNGDYGFRDRFTEECLGVALQLHEDPGCDLLRVVGLPVDLHAPVGAHVALDRADGALRIGDGLPLCLVADEDFAILGERDDRRRGAVPLCVADDLWFSALEGRDDGVGGSEVNAYGASHVDVLLRCACPPVRWCHVSELLRIV